MPGDYHVPPPDIEMGGRLTKGRFGWFIPKRLINKGDLPLMNPYTIFQDPQSPIHQQFVIDATTLSQISRLAE